MEVSRLATPSNNEDGFMKPEQAKFLRELTRWEDGVASSRDIGPQTSNAQNAARRACKRRGWVTYDGYWRLTEAGRSALTATAMKPRVEIEGST